MTRNSPTTAVLLQLAHHRAGCSVGQHGMACIGKGGSGLSSSLHRFVVCGATTMATRRRRNGDNPMRKRFDLPITMNPTISVRELIRPIGALAFASMLACFLIVLRVLFIG